MLKSTATNIFRSTHVWAGVCFLLCLAFVQLGFCTDLYAEVDAVGTNLKKLVFGTGGKTILFVFCLLVGMGFFAAKKMMGGIIFICSGVLFILVGEKCFDLIANNKLKF